jgi:hypothetical protein
MAGLRALADDLARPVPGTRPGRRARRPDRWNRLVTGADLNGPDWIDPAADHHRDLTALTSAIRRELAQATHAVNGTLDMTDRHPCNA